ncbi:hypothetical protein G7Y89_g13380 [Cudoniella acicularis]|uniref:Carboxylic ester hydrolase n=1 Tax=Cudoniella acicularis TaxID=354080 RepID=A0A8H4R9R6_9HELO|nr:hypothetical protein G7Y89_g13380 [Cudoniella acicularis]
MEFSNFSSPLPSTCSAQSIPIPSLYGAEILSLSASLISNYSATVPDYFYLNHPSISVQNATFCNITVTYTHPGQNDTISVEVWLPLDTWNGRMQAIGGGGWIAGRSPFQYQGMSGAIGEGYATITTDAGLGSASDPTNWALLSPGNLNLYNLQNLASVSLNDAASIGKSLITNFYGQPPQYSYWNGCSQGGRQGLMLAQQYPTAYDGIVASAPAINWGEMIVTLFWPQLVMNIMNIYPHGCELKQLTSAAVSACDGNDGILDRIISDVDSCHFSPFSLIGTTFNCSGAEMQISEAAAVVANTTWAGAHSSSGNFLWYGPEYGSVLGDENIYTGIAATECFSNNSCVGKPSSLVTQWIQLFVEKNPSFNYNNLTHSDFDRIYHASVQQFSSIIGTNDPDLSEFQATGGKILAFHGLADQIIPPKGTRHYYDAVTAVTPDVHDFYRVFEVPGLGHCYGGNGGQPTAVFDAMRAWVENGTVPNTLPISFRDANGTENHRILCPYPQKARFDGTGNPVDAESFKCA